MYYIQEHFPENDSSASFKVPQGCSIISHKIFHYVHALTLQLASCGVGKLTTCTAELRQVPPSVNKSANYLPTYSLLTSDSRVAPAGAADFRLVTDNFDFYCNNFGISSDFINSIKA